MVGATVSVPGTSRAAAANIDGIFTINVPEGKNIKITYIGYKTLELLKSRSDMGTITMELAMKHLDDVVVTQSVGKTRETPVAMSTVGADAIDFKLGGQELMEVLKTTPGIYTIRQGGGFGDAETRMRGFKSANVAMMVNGIPINDMEWGGVYQSNWAKPLRRSLQHPDPARPWRHYRIDPSIGGTINITTRTIDVERGGSVWYGMGNDGMNNYGVKVSTVPDEERLVAVTFLGSHKWGDGYVQGTQYNAYNYFFNVSKRLTSSHQLSLTAFGAPQQCTTSARATASACSAGRQ